MTRQTLSGADCDDTDSWIIDSGATCHICNDKTSFIELHTLKKPQDVTLGDGHVLSATGTGDVAVELILENGKTKRCRLHDVLYVPELTYNLLSVSKATEAGKRVRFHSNECKILDEHENVVATATKRGSLYYLACQKVKPQVNQAYTSNAGSKELRWHRRFGHLNERSLQKLVCRKLVNDFDYNTSLPIPFCKSCVEGKIHKSPFQSASRRRAETPLGLVHSDVCGPLSTPSLSKARYFLTFIDDKTHYIWVYFLGCKSEVFSKFLEWKALAE
jgi:hypothetical protein